MNALNSQTFEGLGEAERIALLYAQRSTRRRYRSMLLLDATLARIALTARETTLAQLKLAWWRDACADLASAHGHPLTRELRDAWRDGREPLGGLVDAWEEVVADDDLQAGAEAVAAARCAAFAAAVAVEAGDGCQAAARRWTLVTLAAYAGDRGERDVLLAAAREIGEVRLPRALRPLALLDGLARRALRRGDNALLGDRLSPLAALRLGIFGR